MANEPPSDSMSESHPRPATSGGCDARPLSATEPPSDSEVAAAAAIVAALEPLDDEARARLVRWAAERWDSDAE